MGKWLHLFCVYKAVNMTPFILNDETQINSYGFAVLNAGGKLDRFKKNAVMLSGHDNKNIVGKWNNLSVTDAIMSAEPEFDEADPEALKVKGKVDRGYLKGASIGIVINAMEFKMHNGQMVQCATDWELLEASIVSVPSNANCLRLYNTNGEQLESKEQIQLSLQSFIKNKETTMSEIKLNVEATTALGIANTADGETISKAIIDLAARAKKAEDALAANATLKATALVSAAINDGKITVKEKEAFEKLAVDDYTQAETILGAMSGKTTLGDKIKNTKNAAEDRDGWDFRKYQKEDPQGLAKMYAENFEAYETLRLSYGKQQ
jgi:HK97 family phage prohead protease